MRIRRSRTASVRSPTRSRRGLVGAFDRVRDGGGPQREAVVVLGGEHHVAGPGVTAQLGQRVEVGPGRGVVERPHEAVVGVVLAVDRGVVHGRGAPLDLHGVAVPLRVGVLPQHAPRAVPDQQLLDVGHPRRPARDRVEAPVDEDPQLGVVEPDRHPVGADRLPGPLIHSGRSVRTRHGPQPPLSPGPGPLPPAPAGPGPVPAPWPGFP